MKLWIIPPRVLTLDLLEQELKDTSLLLSQISMKYENGRFEGRSSLMRRFFRYQPYVFLRNKMVSAQIFHLTGVHQMDIPKIVVKFGEWWYNPTEQLIQEQCSELFDYWQEVNNLEKVSEFSLLTTNDIRRELLFLFDIYRKKYEM